MDLSKRTVLITGGSSGIGFGLADAFHKAGSRIIICSRDPVRLEKAGKELPGITAIRCDIGVPEQRELLAEEVLRRFPDFDVLVNNAGIQRHIDLKKGLDEIRSGGDEIGINFTAPVELTSLFVRHLITRPTAAIINVTSGLGFMPMPHTPIYNATKAAMHTYTLALRQQLKGTLVKVVEIVPPMVDTGLNSEGRDRHRMKFRGISVADYIPTVVKGLEEDMDIIFHGEGRNILTEPRGVTETSLLDPKW